MSRMPIFVVVTMLLSSLVIPSWVLAQEATPSGSGQGEPTTEVLFDVAVGDLPTGRGTAGVVRWTLAPGLQPLLIPAQTGPRVFVVESGEVTATEAGIEHRLGPGDVYVAADPEQAVAFRVSGAEDVSLLRAFVSNVHQEATWDPVAHHYEWLIEAVVTALPGGSGRLVLEQLTVQPKSALPPLEAKPLVWMEVGEGLAGVTLEGADLPSGWTPREEQLFGVGALTQRPIPAGTRILLRNAGPDLLVLYRLTLIPGTAASAAGTPPGTPAA